jgi:hypothetical protein
MKSVLSEIARAESATDILLKAGLAWLCVVMSPGADIARAGNFRDVGAMMRRHHMVV